MNSLVLGLNFGTHDSAAALASDGMIIAAAEEERFSRRKQTKAFPEEAISYCLREAGVRASELDRVAFFVNPALQLLLPLANLRHAFPRSLGSFLSDLDKYRKRRRDLALVHSGGILPSTCKVIPVRHHLAHGASAFLASPFDAAAVVTIDGRGEYETLCVFEGRGRQLRRRHAVMYPHSIGYLYSMVTRYLGFRPQRDEYKVMALAAYGGPTYLKALSELARLDDRTGQVRLNLAYFDHHRRPSPKRRLYSDQLISRLGPPRNPDEPITDHHRDVAFALQRLTETLVLGYVGFAKRLVASRNLCLAGGVTLNCVANAAIIESGLFEQVYVQPAAGDAGAGLGAALWVGGLDAPADSRHPLTHMFLGPCFDDTEIALALEKARGAGCTVERVSDPCDRAAKLLAEQRIIGWFQGRMEFGPRALGARSILANPGDEATRARLNVLIKQRELFRPLAPAVLEEYAQDYLHLHDAGRATYPFMLATARVRSAARGRIPAAVHIDGSARVQTVSRQNNPLFWQLINRFSAITGLPLVINTSFNGIDEPIVCTPGDAVRAFLRIGLDELVIGDHVITRSTAVT